MSTIEGGDPVGDGSISNKRARRRSEVWKYYHDSPDGERAICKTCGKSISAKIKMGTSHLKRHVESCQKLLGGSMKQIPFIDWQQEEVRIRFIFMHMHFGLRFDNQSVGLVWWGFVQLEHYALLLLCHK
jgi:BED zinc finger